MSSIPIRRGAASSSASVRFAVLLLLSPFYTSQAMSWTERRRRTVEVSASFNQQIDIDSTSFSDLSRSNAFGAEHDMIAAAAAADPSRLPDVCLEAGPCELCSDSDRISTPECRETGRRQSFRCRPLENTGTSHSTHSGPTITQPTAGTYRFGGVRKHPACLYHCCCSHLTPKSWCFSPCF